MLSLNQEKTGRQQGGSRAPHAVTVDSILRKYVNRQNIKKRDKRKFKVKGWGKSDKVLINADR